MVRKSRYRKVWDQEVTDPQGLLSMAYKYIEWMQLKNYTPQTIKHNRFRLGCFLQWSQDRGIERAGEVTLPILEKYLSYLNSLRNRINNQPLAQSTRHYYFNCVCRFFWWLTRNNHILYNPANQVQLSKLPQPLPQSVLNQHEVEQVINQADLTRPCGIRDRALMEIFYSSGIRVSELIQLTLSDVNLESGVLRIQGKGQKERLVPLGDRARQWLCKYLSLVRYGQIDMTEKRLFLSKNGKPLCPSVISSRIRRYIKAADIGKSGSCHLFRHSMATLMLENGADIRYIQEILGHTHLSTTAIYTRVSISKLKQVHTLTHPGNSYEENDGEE